MHIKEHDSRSAATSDLHVEVWGAGTPVVLVHGSLATGADEWWEQRPLADAGYQLIVPDRRGYGASPAAHGEDFLVDADDIGVLMGSGAHLVGHSYGGISAMIAATRWPEATLSLTLLEPAAASVGLANPAWRAVIENVRGLWDGEFTDSEFVVRFLEAVGSNPAELPEGLIQSAIELVPVFRRGRAFFEADLPLAELAAAAFPKLVVSGGHHDGFEAMCDELATLIGASRTAIPGAGHEIQFVGDPVNDALRVLWS